MLRVMFPEESDSALKVSVGRQVMAGNLLKVGHGLYANPTARSRPKDYPLEALIAYLRPEDFSYLTAETVLSEAGVISQVSSLLVVMTTGKKRVVKTIYGDIEFIHTDIPVRDLKSGTYFQKSRGCYVATVEQAFQDLKRLRRSLDLVDKDELEESILEQRE